LTISCFKTSAHELLTNNANPGQIPEAKQREEIMKKILVAVFVLVVGIVMAGSAFAAIATSGDVTVNAVVSSGCSAIAGGPLNLAIDPATLGAADVTSTGTPATVQCVKHNNATYFSVDAYSAGSALTSNTGSLVGSLKFGLLTPIPYTLTFTATFDGNGFGGPARNVALILAGGVKVLNADALAAEFGSFSDTITLTVNY
jgi:hypothetical protein